MLEPDLHLLPDRPPFGDLTAGLISPAWGGWPSHAQLTRLIQSDVRTATGAIPKFVAPDRAESAYEERIFHTGAIITRPASWHDFFNALVWVRFGHAKAALNACHIADASSGGRHRSRSRRRDALTLLDECGVLLVTCDEQFKTWHTRHDWTRMFVQARSQWGRSIAAYAFGHGLCEQCLQPYDGLTGKALYVNVTSDWFELSLRGRYADLDRRLCAMLHDPGALVTPRSLLPLPVLGIPHWHDANSAPDYYLNTEYFRPLSNARR